MPNQEFKLRRDKLLKCLGNNGIAVIFATKEYGTIHPYRQDSDFYYLTGFIEPDAIAVLIPGYSAGPFILFNRECDPLKESWNGKYVGQTGACCDYGANQSFTISHANKLLPKLLAKRNNIYSNVDFAGDFDRRIISWLNKVRTSTSKSPKLINLGKILHEMRLRKSEAELAIIRKATEITAKGHLRAMKKCRPNMYEFELEAELRYEFTRHGGRHMAFEPIIAGGINACTLHYSKNNKKLAAGELVLIDAGVEYEHYSADVSRTFPISGKFTKEQQKLYEIVLAAQTEVIKKIRPGARWDQLQSTAEHIITTGLIDSGLLRGKIKTLLANQAFKPFFMHKIGHWLGLDTHDVGEYHIKGKWRTLEPGMVLTIEPGIYITPSVTNIDDKWSSTGIRIEDNILVTNNGHEILTAEIPKNTQEIERIMKK